jgi:hypothetical protein
MEAGVIYTPEEWGWLLGILATAAGLLYAAALVIVAVRWWSSRPRVSRAAGLTIHAGDSFADPWAARAWLASFDRERAKR